LIKAITFDLWNTLLEDRDFTDIRMNLLAEILGRQGISRTFEELLEAYRSAAADYRREWEVNYLHMSVESRVDHMLKRLKVDLPRGISKLIVEGFKFVFLKDPPALKEGVRETLEGLRPTYRLGIISDTGVTPGSVIRIYLKEKGILRNFSSTIFSDEIGYCKPHEVVFKAALDELGVKPAEAVHVGDLLRTDVAGAKAMGMRAVWLETEGSARTGHVTPDFVVSDLRQLIPVLNEINASSA